MKLWHGIGLVIGILLLIGGSIALILTIDNAQVEEKQDLSLEIVSITTPIGQGHTATLQARTVPGAYCSIVVHYKSGHSTAAGLYPKEAASRGNVSWSWKVGTRTTPGSWRIVVTASLNSRIASQTTYFTAY